MTPRHSSFPNIILFILSIYVCLPVETYDNTSLRDINHSLFNIFSNASMQCISVRHPIFTYILFILSIYVPSPLSIDVLPVTPLFSHYHPVHPVYLCSPNPFPLMYFL
jgi:hypothetical protein